jgi:hypothetical protein
MRVKTATYVVSRAVSAWLGTGMAEFVHDAVIREAKRVGFTWEEATGDASAERGGEEEAPGESS